jgi:hypothetical protein
LKILFLEALENESEEHIGMLFIMMKTRCPSSQIYDELGNV